MALNRLPPRYIRHEVDFPFYLPDRERGDNELAIADAVSLAFEYVQARQALRHALQQRQATGFGALITFELGSYAAAKKFLDKVEVMSLAESLGGVESLTSHPASMTHASVPADKRAELGITDGLVRISAGIEDLEDLLADTEQALAAI